MVGGLVVQGGVPSSITTIPPVTPPPTPAEGAPSPDPNTSVGGAHQRLGPFWMEEPRWFWVVATITFLLGVALFLVAVGFDRP